MSGHFSPFGALGNLKSEHALSKRLRNTMLIFGAIWLCLLCADIGVSISVLNTSYQESNNVLSALVVPLICVGIFALPGILIAYQQWWSGVFNVAFYDLGISLRTRRGITDIPWRDIDELWLEWTQTGNQYSPRPTLLAAYVFRLKNGEMYRLRSNIEGFNEFEEKFYKPASDAILKNQMDNLQMGKKILINGIGIEQSGLSYGLKSLMWVDIEALRLEKDKLLIKQNGEWIVWETFAFDVPEDVLILSKPFTRTE
jgi:hypothetical protein